MNHAPGPAPGAAAREDRRAVPNLMLSWQQAANVAGCLAVAAVALRLARRSRLTAIAVFTQESALVFALFALWQFAGSFSVMGPGGALRRGRWIWDLERAAHLPSETGVQRLILAHPLIVQAFNLLREGCVHGRRRGRQVGEPGSREAHGDGGDREGQDHHYAGSHAAFSPGKITRLTTTRSSKPKINRTANCSEPRVAVRQTARTSHSRGR